MFWQTAGDSFSMRCFLPLKSQTSSYVFNLSQLSPLLPQEIPKARCHFTRALSDHIWLTIYWPGFPPCKCSKKILQTLHRLFAWFGGKWSTISRLVQLERQLEHEFHLQNGFYLSIVHWSGWLSKKAAPVFMILFSPSVGWCRRLRTNFVFTISLNSCTLYKAAFFFGKWSEVLTVAGNTRMFWEILQTPVSQTAFLLSMSHTN